MNNAPREVRAPPIDSEFYADYLLHTNLREPYRIPPKLLVNTQKFVEYELPEAPLIAFINARSGGRVGPGLAVVLHRAIGRTQVYDLSEARPNTVLKQIWENLQSLAASDPSAPWVQERLRIITAGGDGTVAWVLGTVKDLGIEPPPAVAVIPLGTGNDLARSFGWGGTFDSRWTKEFASIYKMLRRVAEASVQEMDCWKVFLKRPEDDKEKWFQGLPHAFRDQEGDPTTKIGYSWNYVSIGMDAYAAYGFHQVRETKPYLAANRMMNQFWYGYYGVCGGWGCCATPVGATGTLKVQDSSTKEGEWKPVELPKEVKAVVLFNLQSYAGGKNIWGKKFKVKDENRGFKKPHFNDGLIEVVGLKSLWHMAMVLVGMTHGKRIAQASAVRLELKGSGQRDPGEVYMQLDGEPWVQQIPNQQAEQPFVVELQHGGKSKLLLNSQPLNGENFPLHKQVRPGHQQPQDKATQEIEMIQEHQNGTSQDGQVQRIQN